jgi:uncharacterized membrane protein YfcA
MSSELVIVLAGAIAAGFVQGLSGFAFALVALSIWAWGLDPATAAPLAVFGALIGQLAALPLMWRGTDWRRAIPFVAGGLFGVPIGVALLRVLDPAGFELALGLWLLVYSPAMLFAPASLAIKWGGRWADGAIGWLGGLFGGLGGMAGGIPQLWCTLRGWSKEEQRGVMQVFNIAMHTTTLCVYLAAGSIITTRTLQFAAITAPVICAMVVPGALIFRRLNQLAFRRIVLGLLFLSGLALTASSLSHLLG